MKILPGADGASPEFTVFLFLEDILYVALVFHILVLSPQCDDIRDSNDPGRTPERLEILRLSSVRTIVLQSITKISSAGPTIILGWS